MAEDLDDKSWNIITWRVFAVILTLAVVSAGENTIIGALLIRFKELRTIPNIIISNMAVSGLLNSLAQPPIYICHQIPEAHNPMGARNLAFTIGSLHAFLIYLNVFSMLLMVAERYGAVVYGLKYMVWKTRTKAYVAIFLVWSLSALLVAASIISFWGINIPNGTVKDYRKAKFQSTGRLVTAVAIPLLIVVISVLFSMTRHAILRESHQVASLLQGSCTQFNMKRKQEKLKAANTMLIMFVAYIFSYLPLLVYGILLSCSSCHVDSRWFDSFACFSPLIPSVSNPIIFFLRGRRFRQTLKHFFRDPCGKTPLPEPAKKGDDTIVQRRQMRVLSAKRYSLRSRLPFPNELRPETFSMFRIQCKGEDDIRTECPAVNRSHSLPQAFRVSVKVGKNSRSSVKRNMSI